MRRGDGGCSRSRGPTPTVLGPWRPHIRNALTQASKLHELSESLLNLLESARAEGRNQSAGRTESALEGDRHLELTFRPADADDRHSMKGEFTCLPDDCRLGPTSIS
jgi:hypothetical protein